MKRFALFLAASAAFATPSLAADIIFEEPLPPAPAPIIVEETLGFTGFYVGIQGGGAFQSEDPDDLFLDPSFGDDPVPGLTVGGVANSTIFDAFGNSFSSEFGSSFIGGAHIGYDQQFGSFVLGALADINAVDVSSTQSAFSNTPAFYTNERSLDYLVTGRARAGAVVFDRALAYVSGGVAYGEVDYEFFTDSPVVSGNSRSNAAARDADSFDDGEDDFGYTVGGGMEVLLTDNLSFGAEYLYVNLGDDQAVTRLDGGPFDGDSTAGVTTDGFTDFVSDDDFDFHTVTAKLSYRFN